MPDPNTSINANRASPGDETLIKILMRVGQLLGISVEPSDMQFAVPASGTEVGDPLSGLAASAQYAGIFIRETRFSSAQEMIGSVRDGYPVVLAEADGEFVVLESLSGRRVEASVIGIQTSSRSFTQRQLRKRLESGPGFRSFVCKTELGCDAISAAPNHHRVGHQHEHPTPLRRFAGLLSFDRRDIWTVVLFAFVSGILALATPLAIESLVNVVSWGTYLQPLIVLGLMLLTCLGLAGAFSILQTVVVEMIQRRQFVRIVSDLAHRFPLANQASLIGRYPRELANRVFDIMTIQKATAVLLLDGVTIVLTTVLGLLLLAFYHPFLLGFGASLLISMISVIWLLGRGGIRTAIDESITKYRVAHWLQDVIATPSVFKTGGGESLAVQRANQLTADYITARQMQFRVVIRQVTFAIFLQAIASTALLALGGWLVIDGQLTLGQLVASELIVTVVVGAFAKAGKSLEKFYDLMAGIDKVGHLIDVPTDARHELGELPVGPAEVRWGDLVFNGLTSKSKVSSMVIEAGSKVAIVGDDVNGRSLLALTLAGLATPSNGLVEISGFDASHASASGKGRMVGYAGHNDLFHGTLRENVDLGRSDFRQNRVREVLQQVGLMDVVLQLPDGLQTELQTDGYPLNEIQARQLTLARAILAMPRLLVINGLLDELSASDRQSIWEMLTAPGVPWTLVVNTNREDVAKLFDVQIAVRKS